ncbi:hypothetical protein [Sporosarcina luteola]|uniref:hypothetical protein n=1 Tax=Sporosarcina luteola TaxID=582850 RepID=UPI00203F0492|nr:hypothetical protein [Sporosarcina luteola]MCM3711462.1 hypothetical protein [Sporosarcina luteola]
MTISIHDGVLVGYSVSFLENELLLDIKTVANEIVTVTFENYLAHYFDHVMAGSILFDIEEVDLKRFIVENREELESRKSFDWPIRYNDTNDLEKYLQKNNYKCYLIFASLGLSGYTFAKTLKIKRK